MQFSLITVVAALAATSTASFIPRQVNGTTVAPYPTAPASSSSMPSASGTVSLMTTGTPKPTSISPLPFSAAAAPAATQMAGSALGLVVAGGVALVSFYT